jgi:hypothetical protein
MGSLVRDLIGVGAALRPGTGSAPELAQREFGPAPDRLAFGCRGHLVFA